MRDVSLLLVGVLAGGMTNLAVQLFLELRRQRRERRLAIRVIYNELLELGNLEINAGPLDPSHLQAAWREHRSSLVDLGDEKWNSVQDAVTYAAYPDLFPPIMDSHNSILEGALVALEPEAGLPHSMRGFI